MKTALIIMTILGCDDSVSQCHYISTVPGTWETVAVCDAESQKQLPNFSNANYPVVVAMCENSDEQLADTPKALEQAPPANTDTAIPAAPATSIEPTPAQQAEQKPTMPKRALAFLSGALPDTTKLRDVVTAPVHSIQNGYSWVARRFD
ncbi:MULTISPECIES: hypothetical protein [unclassified Rhizobium]|uniref:hypothetical protein n=1 Tax=unclassified Rhizobium TaxID=2613769 RepID=UPI0006F74161|nr:MULTISPECIES: hypothetical protein [unclassified Rhizobium]KQV42521.1 hypothetical protein ASC86_19500 [Rhizobium sp. Root1212]KRD21449.1 hypothetical protein ASE37_18095 [Rhizobium sp. Root268]